MRAARDETDGSLFLSFLRSFVYLPRELELLQSRREFSSVESDPPLFIFFILAFLCWFSFLFPPSKPLGHAVKMRSWLQ